MSHKSVEAYSDAAARANEQLQQTNKRLTLNLLIQGAAAHAFLTAHHLVKDELEAIRPGLTKLYDRFAIAGHLNYWIGDLVLVHGAPSRFWRRTKSPTHPFHRHALLAKHGGALSQAAKRSLIARGWKKRVIGIPVIHYLQTLWLLIRVMWVERGKQAALEATARRATAMIWGIDEERLEAELTSDRVEFGSLRVPKTLGGKLTRFAIVGYGGVSREAGRFKVVAKAWNWPLVLHELVKGTAELVCLHGLNTLDEKMYESVTEEADQLEYEAWMLQAGPELWRRLLAVMPNDRPLAEVLMHLARLDPVRLEHVMLAVIEEPEGAREMLARLGN